MVIENLEKIELHKNIYYIGDCAFSNCLSLKELKWENNICELDHSAFSFCPNLTTVYINDLDNWMQSTFVEGYSNPLNNGADLYLNDMKLITLDLTKSYSKISQNAFCGCKSIEKLISNADIEKSSFSQCSNLKTVTLKEGITNIKEGAFNGCENLCNLSIPYTIKSIENYAFWNCYSLRNIDYYGNSTSWSNMITTNYTLPLGVKVNYLLSIEANWINGIVTINCSQSIKDKTLIIASYLNNVFENIYSVVVENDELSQTIDFTAPTGSNIKVFVWESFSSCKPSCSAITIEEQTIMTDDEINQAEFLKIYSEQGLLAAIESGLYESENTLYILRNPKFAQEIEEEYPSITSIEKLEAIITQFRKSTQSGTNSGIYS